jgi:hypothetical protein
MKPLRNEGHAFKEISFTSKYELPPSSVRARQSVARFVMSSLESPPKLPPRPCTAYDEDIDENSRYNFLRIGEDTPYSNLDVSRAIQAVKGLGRWIDNAFKISKDAVAHGLAAAEALDSLGQYLNPESTNCFLKQAQTAGLELRPEEVALVQSLVEACNATKSMAALQKRFFKRIERDIVSSLGAFDATATPEPSASYSNGGASAPPQSCRGLTFSDVYLEYHSAKNRLHQALVGQIKCRSKACAAAAKTASATAGIFSVRDQRAANALGETALRAGVATQDVARARSAAAITRFRLGRRVHQVVGRRNLTLRRVALSMTDCVSSFVSDTYREAIVNLHGKVANEKVKELDEAAEVVQREEAMWSQAEACLTARVLKVQQDAKARVGFGPRVGQHVEGRSTRGSEAVEHEGWLFLLKSGWAGRRAWERVWVRIHGRSLERLDLDGANAGERPSCASLAPTILADLKFAHVRDAKSRGATAHPSRAELSAVAASSMVKLLGAAARAHRRSPPRVGDQIRADRAQAVSKRAMEEQRARSLAPAGVTVFFDVTSPSGILRFAAESVAEKEAWTAELKAATKSLLAGSAPVNITAGEEGSEWPGSRVLTMQSMRQLLRRTCDDCGRENPEWASTSLGCLVCIECSGSVSSSRPSFCFSLIAQLFLIAALIFVPCFSQSELCIRPCLCAHSKPSAHRSKAGS